MTYNSLVLSIVTFIYGFAALLYIAAWIFRREESAAAATWVTLAGWLGNTLGILLRWFESYRVTGGHGYAPFSNLYESLVFFAWTIAVIYLIVEWRYKTRTIGAFALPLAFLALAYASLSPSKDIQPLIPALKSNWLIAHVITCFIGYAAFAVAFGTSLMFLIKNSRNSKPSGGLAGRLPDKGLLDELNHQLIMFGFLFLTVGIITGAVWANSAWGRYWGWDPKETWSFITWLIYAAILHFRLMAGWRGPRIAVLAIIGFAAVLFTYFGVNLLPGLHSYGAMKG